MQDPHTLYEPVGDPPTGDAPVLVQALGGFVDAGGGTRLAREHLMEHLEHRMVTAFDVDQLLDYRARRPLMTFVEDHWEHYEPPVLALHEVTDAAGTPFLLLAGPEPDYQWERFTAAVGGLVERFGVRLTVGLNSIPMAVPHTRPIGITAHATRPELVRGYEAWVHTVAVPASAGALLEFRLGEAGRAAAGFAVHVPHYLSQAEYPGAAQALLEAVASVSGLALPVEQLATAARRTRVEVDAQVAQASEVAAVVRGLEEQYDAFVASRGRSLLATESAALPTADELGAELERFLAEQTRPNEG